MAEVRTGVLIILDGFGNNPQEKFNAVAQAKTPHLDRLFSEYPSAQLEASEANVGLPDGFMGNSEVGHLNIGAGRIVHQDFSRISQAIDQGDFFENAVFLKVCETVRKEKRGTLHLMGLVSDGGVHSHLSHLMALLQLARKQKVTNVAIHCFMDGRDTAPTSGLGFIRRLSEFCQDLGVGKIATVSGRFYAMDRDQRWERTEQAYQAIVPGQATSEYSEAADYIERCYDEGTTDEFIVPSTARDYAGVKDGDAVVFFNFRADRARQLTAAMTQIEFSHFRRKALPTLSGFACMTSYDEKNELPVAFPKPHVEVTLGEIVSRQGWRQLRIAETEKYAHVTYFFNGGKEEIFEGEKRVLIPSPKEVRTYDQKPEMSADEVTETLLKRLKADPFEMVVVNFANPDMVGHTGNLTAAIQAVESVDRCVGRIVDWVERNDAFAIVTADHGNCEMMQSEDGLPLTSHTCLPVPFLLVDAKRKGVSLRSTGRLCDIAPTFLEVWGLPCPKEMTGRSMLQAELA